MSLLISIVAGVYIFFSWDENKFLDEMNDDSYMNNNLEEEDFSIIEDNDKSNLLGRKTYSQSAFFKKIYISYKIIIGNKPLFALGIIESCFKISLTLFNFMWTPLLEGTIKSNINPGAIFIMFMLARLIGSEIFDGSKKILKTNTFFISIIVNVTAAVTFISEYEIPSFRTRLLLLIYFDGLSGIFTPLMSSLKSQMIPEKHRTTIMTFFRIPYALFSILALFGSQYVSTGQICIMAFIFMIIASIVNIILFKLHTPPDAEKRKVLTSTKISQAKLKGYKELVDKNTMETYYNY